MEGDKSVVDRLVFEEFVLEFVWDFDFEGRWKDGLDGSCHFLEEEDEDMISEYCGAMNWDLFYRGRNTKQRVLN